MKLLYDTKPNLGTSWLAVSITLPDDTSRLVDMAPGLMTAGLMHSVVMITDLELVAVIPRAAKSLDGMPPAFKSLDPAFGKLLTTGACKLLTFACCCCELWISGGLSCSLGMQLPLFILPTAPPATLMLTAGCCLTWAIGVDNLAGGTRFIRT